MGDNILRAILNIVSFGNTNLKSYASTYLSRVNAVGEQLEFYLKDAIASSFNLAQNKKEEEYSRVFSYSGNQNNPPDMIIRKGDAFEIKKIKTPSASLALKNLIFIFSQVGTAKVPIIEERTPIARTTSG